MATHSSILAWKILWTEEPGRPQSMGPQRIRCIYIPLMIFTQSSVDGHLLPPYLLPGFFWGSTWRISSLGLISFPKKEFSDLVLGFGAAYILRTKSLNFWSGRTLFSACSLLMLPLAESSTPAWFGEWKFHVCTGCERGPGSDFATPCFQLYSVDPHFQSYLVLLIPKPLRAISRYCLDLCWFLTLQVLSRKKKAEM